MGLFSKKEKVYPKVSDIFSEECLQKILAVVKPRLENGGYGNNNSYGGYDNNNSYGGYDNK